MQAKADDFTMRLVHARLTEWAKEYGGGRYESLTGTGTHILAKLIEFGGFMPSSSSPVNVAAMTRADEVQRAVLRLAKDWPAHAKILQCDYLSPDKAMPSRLDWLRERGVRIGKSQYYVMLESAKMFVSGLL